MQDQQGLEVLKARIKQGWGKEPKTLAPLLGGCVAEVFRVGFADGEELVVKKDANAQIEADSLRTLQALGSFPTPRVLGVFEDLLLLEYLPNDSSRLGGEGLADFTEKLCALHDVTEPRFGFPCDTLLGGIKQDNTWQDHWPSFYTQQRLLPLARKAQGKKLLPPQAVESLRSLFPAMEARLEEGGSVQCGSLLHGDLWSGNMLTRKGRLVGVIDPAIYYGHPEIELAFLLWLGSLGKDFLSRYHARRPLLPDFLEVRYPIYILYPLLSHILIMGASYVPEFLQTLGQLQTHGTQPKKRFSHAAS